MDWNSFITDCITALFLAAFICIVGAGFLIGVFFALQLGKLGIAVVVAFLLIFIALVVKAWFDNKD